MPAPGPTPVAATGVGYQFSAAGSAAVATTTALTSAVGDTVVVKLSSGTSHLLPDGVPTASAGGITFTQVLAVNTASTTACPLYIWVGTVTVAAAFTVSVPCTYSSTANHSAVGFTVELFRGVTLPATPNATGSTTPATTAPYTNTLTTATAGSLVSWVAGDFNGAFTSATPPSVTPQAGSITYDWFNTAVGSLDHYTGYQTAAGAGAQTYGYSTSPAASQSVTAAAVELPPTLPVTVTDPRTGVVEASGGVDTPIGAAPPPTTPVTVTDPRTGAAEASGGVVDQVAVTALDRSTIVGGGTTRVGGLYPGPRTGPGPRTYPGAGVVVPSGTQGGDVVEAGGGVDTPLIGGARTDTSAGGAEAFSPVSGAPHIQQDPTAGIAEAFGQASETVAGATSGTLSNLPIVRVLADFTASPPTIPSNTDGAGNTVELTRNLSVTALKVRRGRQYELGQVDAGTAVLDVHDPNELLNPANTSSPYNTGPASIQSYRPVKVTAVWAGVQYSLFTGFVERYPQTWIHAGFRGVKPLECVDALGILANVLVRQSYFDTIMVDEPTVWIPFNDPSGPGSAYVKSPQALVSGGASLPGNPRVGTSAYYQTSLLVSGTGLRVDEFTLNNGQVSWGGDQMPDGTPALALSAPVTQPDSTTGAVVASVADAQTAGGTLSLDTSGCTIEFWAKFTSGTCRVEFLSSLNARTSDTPADGVIAVTPYSDNSFHLLVRLPGVLNGTYVTLPSQILTSTDKTAHDAPDGAWHYYAFSFVPNAAGTGSDIIFFMDGSFGSTSGAPVLFAHVGINRILTEAYYDGHGGIPAQCSVFGVAYYSHPLSVGTLQRHYLRGAGNPGDLYHDRVAKLITTYYDRTYSNATYGYENRMDTDFHLGVSQVPGSNGQTAATPSSVLAALRFADHAEQGLTHVAGDGTIHSNSRSQRARAAQAGSLARPFGDRPIAGELPYTAVEYDFDPTYVYSNTQLTKTSGGPTIVQQGNTSLGARTYSTSVQLYYEWDLFQLGMMILTRYGSQRLRVRTIVVEPDAHPALWPVVLGQLDIGTVITVIRRTAPGTLIVGNYYVEHIDHDVNAAAGTWKMTMQLSPVFYSTAQATALDMNPVLGSTATVVH